MGVDPSDTSVLVPFTVDPVTNALLANVVGDSITSTPIDKDRIDENNIHTIYGVSSVDGVTLIPIRTDTDGNLLATF